jgi:adenylate cyclase
MATEIERKFLVSDAFKADATKSFNIQQGYLSSNPERSVRIRIRDQQAFITVKGKSSDDGTSRFEWEKEITLSEAENLLQFCEPGIIRKTRYIIPAKDNLFFEVDEFYGENEGLRMAEIELPHKDYPFPKPSWLGREVTGNPKYYNAALSKHPYSRWKKDTGKD